MGTTSPLPSLSLMKLCSHSIQLHIHIFFNSQNIIIFPLLMLFFINLYAHFFSSRELSYRCHKIARQRVLCTQYTRTHRCVDGDEWRARSEQNTKQSRGQEFGKATQKKNEWQRRSATNVPDIECSRLLSLQYKLANINLMKYYDKHSWSKGWWLF